MNYRNTLIVLIVLAALIAFVAYDQQQPSATATATVAATISVLNGNAADVVGLTVSGPVSRTVAHRDNNVWQLDEPRKEEADTTRLDGLVQTFAKLNATRVLTNTPSDLGAF